MSAATERAPIHVSREIHQQIKITAATEGCSMKALTERLLRLGMAVDATPNGATARELRSAFFALQGDPDD